MQFLLIQTQLCWGLWRQKQQILNSIETFAEISPYFVLLFGPALAFPFRKIDLKFVTKKYKVKNIKQAIAEGSIRKEE